MINNQRVQASVKILFVILTLMMVGVLTEAQAQCNTTCTRCNGNKYTPVKTRTTPVRPIVIRDPKTKEIIDVLDVMDDCPEPCAEVCSQCSGKGTYCPPPPPNPCTCGTCGGDGKQTHHVIHTYETVELSCKTCGGDGNKCN